MLPFWADVLIVLAIPVILLTILKLMGEDEPDNTVVHHSDDPPDSSGDGPEELLAAA